MIQEHADTAPDYWILEIDAEGAITLPAALLEELGIRTGDWVRLWQEGGCLKMAAARGKPVNDE